MNATKAMTLLAAAAVGFSAQALTLAVKDVKMAQRYPWNGLVDIDYTVECDDKDAPVYVYPVGYDADMNQSVALYTLSGEGVGEAVKAGTHRMTWDMSKDMGENYNRAKFSVKMHAYAGAAPYMVIDLSGGSSAEKYSVSYLDKMPDDVWPAEYKRNLMVFKLIPPGTFMMGSTKEEQSKVDMNSGMKAAETLHKVTLTQPFYCSVFEITEKQHALIMGGTSENSSAFYGYSYDYLRGATLGTKWPEHQQVDATSLIGVLRTRTGITIDLPTEAQWEYACRAGSADSRSPNPNAWGLYGMNEAPSEWCRDWLLFDLGSAPVKDPAGPYSGHNGCRVVRGVFGWNYYDREGDNRTASRVFRFVNNGDYYFTPNVCGNERWWTPGFGCRLVALPAAK